MLNIARSNLRYPAQILFLGLNATGCIFGLAYNSKTLDLYPKNSHHKLGWVLTATVTIQFVIGLVRSFVSKNPDFRVKYEKISSTQSEDPGDHVSSDSATSSQCYSPDHERSETSTDGTDSDTLRDVQLHYNSQLQHRFSEPICWSRRWANVSASCSIYNVLEFLYDFVDRMLVVLGFLAICTGVVTMAGIFVR